MWVSYYFSLWIGKNTHIYYIVFLDLSYYFLPKEDNILHTISKYILLGRLGLCWNLQLFCPHLSSLNMQLPNFLPERHHYNWSHHSKEKGGLSPVFRIVRRPHQQAWVSWLGNFLALQKGHHWDKRWIFEDFKYNLSHSDLEWNLKQVLPVSPSKRV